MAEQWNEKKLVKLLDGSKKLELRVENTFNGIEKPFSALILVNPKEYLQVKDAIISAMEKSFDTIIYITINSAYKKILRDLKKNEIPFEKVHFIDMISPHSGVKTEDRERVTFLESPSDLSDCILALDKIASSKTKNTVVVLDSVSAMLVYNDASSIQKFTHALLAKITSAGFSALLLSSDVQEKESITKTISQFVDTTALI